MEWFIPLFVGWFFGQGGTLIQNKISIWRKKKSVIEEVAYLSSEANEAIDICNKAKDDISTDSSFFSISHDFKSTCFDSYFADTFLAFHPRERKALMLFYGHVANYEKQIPQMSGDDEGKVRTIIQRRMAATMVKMIGDDLVKRREYNLSTEMGSDFKNMVSIELSKHSANDLEALKNACR